MPRKKGQPKPIVSAIRQGVPIPPKRKEALIAKAAAACQRGEYENPTHAAHSFVNDYYLCDVWARDEATQYDRKVRHLAALIKAIIRRS